jgi:hypothetical protein
MAMMMVVMMPMVVMDGCRHAGIGEQNHCDRDSQNLAHKDA